MKNKGFTLVELLAVIVLLGTVLLITTPSVLSTISKSRVKSAKQSLKGFLDTIELKLTSDTYTTENKLKNGYYNVEDLSNYDIKFKGSLPTSGWIAVEKDEVKYYSLVINNRYVFTKDYLGETMIEGNVPKQKTIYTLLYRNSLAMTVNGQTVASSIPGQQQYYVCDYDKQSMDDCGVSFSSLEKCQNFISQMSALEGSTPPFETCVLKDYISPELNTTSSYSEYSDYSPYIKHVVDSDAIINYSTLCVNLPSGQYCIDNDNDYNNIEKKLDEYVKFNMNTWKLDSENDDSSKVYINSEQTITVKKNNDLKSEYVFYDKNHAQLLEISINNSSSQNNLIGISIKNLLANNSSNSSTNKCEMFYMGDWFSYCTAP